MNHTAECGTAYRGCAPDCPKEMHEQELVAQGVNDPVGSSELGVIVQPVEEPTVRKCYSHKKQVDGKLYTHDKSGVVYSVHTIGFDCTNERDGLRVVVYSQYVHPGQVFVREEQEFLKKFTLHSRT